MREIQTCFMHKESAILRENQKWSGKMKSVFFACVVAFGVATASSYETVEEKNPLILRSPSLSSVKTKKIRLKNGLEAYIISDSQANKSAAAVSVEAGSWDDPEAYPGMAHFCEHMLFMGSKKYPDENTFFKQVLDNGGNCNAYTAPDRTVYMFSSDHAPFNSTLDVFAQFFIAPLMKEDSVKRELLAVNQEFSKSIENDSWRQWMIFKETGNQNHPNAKFSTGTKDTLSIIPLATLHNWYKTHYNANKMHLVILTNQDVDQMAKTVSDTFSSVSNSNPPPLTFEAISSTEQKGHIVFIEPVKDLRTLSIAWEIPSEITLDKESKSPNLIAYALGHKGKLSLFESLKQAGLAEDLSAQVEPIGKGSSFISLEISLTKRGVAQLDSVIECAFIAVNDLKKQKFPPYIFTEYKKMAELNFEWQSRSDEFRMVSMLADSAVEEPLSTFPYKNTSITTFKPASIKEVLNEMTPNNALFTVVAPASLTKQSPNRQEKWLGGKYSIVKIDAEKLDLWANIDPIDSITSPPQNIFIPSHLSLLSPVQEKEVFEPTLLSDDENGKCYFLQDHYYLVPEVSISLGIRSPLIAPNTRSITLVDLYLIHLQRSLSSTLSVAKRAGFDVSLSQDNAKLSISTSGYDEKSALLITRITEELGTSIPNREEFELYKEDLLSRYENQEKCIPYFQAKQLIDSILVNDSPLGNDLFRTLQKISYEDFITFSEQLFAKIYLEGIISGNLTETNAKKLWNTIKGNFHGPGYPTREHVNRTVLVLQEGKGPFTVEKNSDMKGNASLLLLQMGPASFDNIAVQKILSSVLRESFFDTLRTKQQTGYITQSWLQDTDDQLMLFFGVHSTTHNPQELLARFELFLEDTHRDLETNIPSERFNSLKETQILAYTKPPHNLQNKVELLTYLGFEKQGDFMRRQKVIESLQTLTYEQFISAARAGLSRDNTRRLATLISGTDDAQASLTYTSISPEQARSMISLR
jgi:insulysin